MKVIKVQAIKVLPYRLVLISLLSACSIFDFSSILTDTKLPLKHKKTQIP